MFVIVQIQSNTDIHEIVFCLIVSIKPFNSMVLSSFYLGVNKEGKKWQRMIIKAIVL